MKIFWSSILAIILAGAISYFVPVFTVNNTTLNTLYTVAGIMFSIGMSLSVTSNTSGVRNKTIRNRIRKNMNQVRNFFIYHFLLTSLCYIIYLYKETINIKAFTYKIDVLALVIIIMSIIYYIVNFIAIQRLNEQIEEAINEQ
jgi:hypothetical protein